MKWTDFFSRLYDRLLCLAFHVTSSGSFPPALTPAREQELLKQFQSGDLKARDELIEHNLRLVAHIIKKYYAAYSDQDDLISIGTIGLIKAINTFKPERQIRLATYASRCIENEVLMHFRSSRKSAQDLHMGDSIDTDSDGNPLTLMDILYTEDTITEDLDTKMKSEQVNRYVNELADQREKDIIKMRYGLDRLEPLTQRETAAHLHISRSYVSRIEKRALEKLRAAFEKNAGKK